MNNKLRMTAASLAAAVALGVAGPAAHAATESAPKPVAASQTVQLANTQQARILTQSLASEGISAQVAGNGSAVTYDASAVAKAPNWGWIIKALKRVPGAWTWSKNLIKKAVSLGKTKGLAYIKKAINELSSWSPKKWVWKSIVAVTGWGTQLWDAITWIYHHM
ncbi:hypothetical protein D9753_25120 [Streptomyces dangxiongensis]|uniref:Secreted protein n=1 Tax=Streptomyces dangxiongensis TaxID=1442032 RepID=A0A3G2JJP2_9ACTN|nr:hypothetical protein [Streptomyces dangxiongensis]AYN41615.1 hypothetical protein D9753_25120 [Streptomyces dangxiongensis]